MAVLAGEGAVAVPFASLPRRLEVDFRREAVFGVEFDEEVEARLVEARRFVLLFAAWA